MDDTLGDYYPTRRGIDPVIVICFGRVYVGMTSERGRMVVKRNRTKTISLSLPYLEILSIKTK
jgi:hypothetical protein